MEDTPGASAQKSKFFGRSASPERSKSTYESVIGCVRENKNDRRRIRYSLFLKAYENAELVQMERQNKREKLKLRMNEWSKWNTCIHMKGAKEKQRLKLLNMLKNYQIKYQTYSNLKDLCDYSVYFDKPSIGTVPKESKSILEEAQRDNFFFHLVSMGVSYNDIILVSSVFQNREHLKNCNLFMLPWIYRKLNDFHSMDVITFLIHCVGYSLSTFPSSLFLFLQYRSLAIVFPLFFTYMCLSLPFLFQEINCGRFVLDGCLSFFVSLDYYHLPIGIILIISYVLSIINCVDIICLQVIYFSFYLAPNNPWVYRNVDAKICSKFNASRSICDFARNICFYNEATAVCELNRVKLGTKIYDTLLSKYAEPKSEKFAASTVLLSFGLLILYNAFSKFKTSHKVLKIHLSILILVFASFIITMRDFSLLEFLLADFGWERVRGVLLDHEVWIACMMHCALSMSLHSGMYFYTAKGLRNVFYILLPVGNNCFSKFSFFLGINISVVFLAFMLLAASKRVEVLFLSFDDVNFFKPKSRWFDVRWVFLFLLYYLYSSVDITFLDLFFTEMSQIVTLLILFYINFNFFWVRGFNKTMDKFGMCPLLCQVVLTALNLFLFFYFEIIFRLPNRVPLYLVRQLVNICVIPLVSVLLSRCASFGGPKQPRGGGLQQILADAYELATECADKSKNIQLEPSQTSKWFNLYMVLFCKYLGIDLIFMCFVHVGSSIFSIKENFFKKKNVHLQTDPYLLFFLLFLCYVYVAYVNVPLLQLIKRRKLFPVNKFSILDYPVCPEEPRRPRRGLLFEEFKRGRLKKSAS
ncbi:amino acid transporter, putative [Plasmodium vivax]|uniref:Amino acid transporter, putative n=1 Tax=Plasmodium vivax TaxID=5855 RepID=A0A564ZY02_PLAVI|nr:amino acid transporter, putative [Plasmodium vivax]